MEEGSKRSGLTVESLRCWPPHSPSIRCFSTFYLFTYASFSASFFITGAVLYTFPSPVFYAWHEPCLFSYSQEMSTVSPPAISWMRVHISWSWQIYRKRFSVWRQTNIRDSFCHFHVLDEKRYRSLISIRIFLLCIQKTSRRIILLLFVILATFIKLLLLRYGREFIKIIGLITLVNISNLPLRQIRINSSVLLLLLLNIFHMFPTKSRYGAAIYSLLHKRSHRFLFISRE